LKADAPQHGQVVQSFADIEIVRVIDGRLGSQGAAFLVVLLDACPFLVGTAWVTARRREGETSIFDWVALLIPLALGIGGWIKGLKALHSPTGSGDGIHLGMNFFMSSVLLLAAAGDIRMLVRGGVFGAQRIVRHLWRMCFGLFIATGSFFLGQGSKVFPAFIRDSNVLLIPALLPLILLIFCLIRVRFTNAYKRMPMPRGGDVFSLRT
jgi:hypothetical protein